jgi:hypothetical protein
VNGARKGNIFDHWLRSRREKGAKRRKRDSSGNKRDSLSLRIIHNQFGPRRNRRKSKEGNIGGVRNGSHNLIRLIKLFSLSNIDLRYHLFIIVLLIG